MLDNCIRITDDVIFDFGLLVIIAHNYGIASHRDIHGKPPTQNSLQ